LRPRRAKAVAWPGARGVNSGHVAKGIRNALTIGDPHIGALAAAQGGPAANRDERQRLRGVCPLEPPPPDLKKNG